MQVDAGISEVNVVTFPARRRGLSRNEGGGHSRGAGGGIP